MKTVLTLLPLMFLTGTAFSGSLPDKRWIDSYEKSKPLKVTPKRVLKLPEDLFPGEDLGAFVAEIRIDDPGEGIPEPKKENDPRRDQLREGNR